jgi:exosortase K
MNTRLICRRNLQLVVVLLGALALKQFYASASVNQLRWLLAPTKFLVELITGARFEFESYAGYFSSDRTFVIAASCAGVNFMLTAFLLLSLRKLWTDGRASWQFIPACACLAYLATIVANTIRISTALSFQCAPVAIAGLSANQLHRCEGIFIYFGCLWLLFLLSERMSGDRLSETDARTAVGPNQRAGMLRQFCFPLLIYYATTLGIPLVTAAYRPGPGAADFREHFVFVLLVPLLLLVPLVIVRRFKHQRLD